MSKASIKDGPFLVYSIRLVSSFFLRRVEKMLFQCQVIFLFLSSIVFQVLGYDGDTCCCGYSDEEPVWWFAWKGKARGGACVILIREMSLVEEARPYNRV
jgi:hypothetical protein